MIRTLLLFGLLFGGTLSLFAQPPSDTCSNAIVVSLDEVVNFTTIAATTDGPTHEVCFGTMNDSIPHDIWYTFTAGFTGEAIWSNCSTADFDSRIAVYMPGASCPPTDADILDCNDDGPGCAASTSELIFLVNSGETYLLRMGGYAGDDGIVTEGSGTFVITEATGGPANNFCANAVPLSLGSQQSFTTAGATTDGPDHPDNPCFGFGSITADNDIWFTFTPDYTGFAEWSACSTINFDSRLAVYNPGSPCPPADGDLMSCNDDGPDCENFSSLLIFEVTEGETYLLRLGGYNGESGLGTFDLNSIIPADPPANDLCADAEVVNIITAEVAADFEGVNNGTTVAATFDPEDFIFPQCVGNPQGEAVDVWYQVNTLGNDTLDLRFFVDNDNPASAFYMDVFQACDAVVDTNIISGSCFFVDEASGNFGSSLVTGLPDGEDIVLYIRITTHITFNSTGGFFFQVVGSVVTGINNPNFAKDLSFAPNPASDKGFVQFQLEEDAEIETSIFNLLGQKMLSTNQGNLASGQHKIPVDVSSLNPGLYLLQINSGNQRQSLKILIQ